MTKKQKRPIKIIGQRTMDLNLSNPTHEEKIANVCRALSTPIRLKIVRLLQLQALSVQEIAKILEIPVSSTAAHIHNLEEAGLIVTESQPGKRGSMRVCICSLQYLHIDVSETEVDPYNNCNTIEMPIGNYNDFYVVPTCGLADENGAMDSYDNPISFCAANRFKAQLLWFQQGYVEYRFPNQLDPKLPLKEISFSMEICSEAPGHKADWPSDITITINKKDVITYRSPGDFGNRRGVLTPQTWGYGSTQYGMLKTFGVTEQGCFLDGELMHSELVLQDLNIEGESYISLIIGIKEDAKYVGGINLFGEKFGDHPIGIVMKIMY